MKKAIYIHNNLKQQWNLECVKKYIYIYISNIYVVTNEKNTTDLCSFKQVAVLCCLHQASLIAWKCFMLCWVAQSQIHRHLSLRVSLCMRRLCLISCAKCSKYSTNVELVQIWLLDCGVPITSHADSSWLVFHWNLECLVVLTHIVGNMCSPFCSREHHRSYTFKYVIWIYINKYTRIIYSYIYIYV